MKPALWRRPLLWAGLYCGVFIATSALGGLAYFHFGDPQQTCASCHEMTSVHSDWSVSSHRTVHCRNCHGGSLTLDVHAIESHLNRVVRTASFLDAAPSVVRIRLPPHHVDHIRARPC